MRNAVRAAFAAAVLLALRCGSKNPTYESISAGQPGQSGSGGHEIEGKYVRRDLVSDGFLPAEQPPDADLVNAWGSPRSPPRRGGSRTTAPASRRSTTATE